MKHVGLIDYGMSNLGSVRRTMEECGAFCEIVLSPDQLKNKTHIILPGVGSFFEGMSHIRSKGWDQALTEYVVAKAIPLLGICLGMQLLAEKGTEGGTTAGLGFIPGEVTKLVTQDENERLPHIGWNEIYASQESSLLKNIADGSDFYFVHSYHLVTDDSYVLMRTPYCGGFVSAVHHHNIFGVQFHPEKSQRNGRSLFKNFLDF